MARRGFTGGKDMTPSKSVEALRKLKKQYPKDSEEALLKRFAALFKMSDESRAELVGGDVAAGWQRLFRMTWDEEYNELVREGREVPEWLRRPS
jgi:hypothetical protein